MHNLIINKAHDSPRKRPRTKQLSSSYQNGAWKYQVSKLTSHSREGGKLESLLKNKKNSSQTQIDGKSFSKRDPTQQSEDYQVSKVKRKSKRKINEGEAKDVLIQNDMYQIMEMQKVKLNQTGDFHSAGGDIANQIIQEQQ